MMCQPHASSVRKRQSAVAGSAPTTQSRADADADARLRGGRSAAAREGRQRMSDNATGPAAVERPVLANEPGDYWGSDTVALMLRELDLPYVALNPGASYRGLHDSLVNLLGNTQPQMLLCLHEEHAVAIAHGYAKVTGRPMGAIVHSNVGLMHPPMAILNAGCDRVPMVFLGATGPWDAASRRPWIDWLHTCAD